MTRCVLELLETSSAYLAPLQHVPIWEGRHVLTAHPVPSVFTERSEQGQETMLNRH